MGAGVGGWGLEAGAGFEGRITRTPVFILI